MSDNSLNEKLEGLQKTVDWLVEQRKAERDHVEATLRDVSRILQSSRDTDSKIDLIENEIRQQRGPVARLPITEEALKGVRESIAALQAQLENSQEAQERQTLLRSSEIERDRRSLSEYGQKLGETQRLADSSIGKVLALAEEVKRDRGSVALLPQTIDEAVRKTNGLVGRIAALEETIKRNEGRFGTSQERDEALTQDINRIDNWQRLADVRWARQATEWQSQINFLKIGLEEQSRPIVSLTRSIGKLQEDASTLTGGLSELVKKLDDQGIAIRKLDGLLSVAREGTIRVEVTVDAQRRRIDEQVSGLYRLEERIQGNLSQIGEIEHRIDGQDTRIEEVLSQVRLVDAQRQRAEDGVHSLGERLRDLASDTNESTIALQEIIASDRRTIQNRIADLNQAHLKQKRTLLSLVQVQAQEWSTIVGSDGIDTGSSQSSVSQSNPMESPTAEA